MNSENDFDSVLNNLAEKIEKAKFVHAPTISTKLYELWSSSSEEDSSSSSEDGDWETNNTVYTNDAVNYPTPAVTHSSSSSSSQSSSQSSTSSVGSDEDDNGGDDIGALKIHNVPWNSPVTFEINNLNNKILWFTVGNNQAISQDDLDSHYEKLSAMFEPHGAKILVSDSSLNLKGVFKFNTNNNKNDKGEQLKVF